MNTVDVFVVIRDMGYDGEGLAGIYQRKEDAEFIRDHLEAIVYNDLRDRWLRYEFKTHIDLETFIRGWCHETFRVEEEDLYV